MTATINISLANLKTEQAHLQQILRSYERDFFGQHKRPVLSYTDIRPVEHEYLRYKEIREEIARKDEEKARLVASGVI